MRWLLLLLIVPITDLMLLVLIGIHIGALPTVGFCAASAVIGVVLASHEGLRLLTRAREALREGRVPDEGLTDGLLVLGGGLALIVPGVVTDALGIVLLVPWTRRRVAAFVRERIERKLHDGSMRFVSLSMPVAGPFGGAGWHDDEESDSPRHVITTEGVEVQSTRLLGEGDGGAEQGEGDTKRKPTE